MNDFSYSFVQGFLYFFGLVDNPAKSIESNMLNKSDYESLSGDWYKIGNDIRKSYETCKSTID